MIRDERGSASIEAVVVGPAVVLMILLVVFGGRVAFAHQTVQEVAADTARAASLARTQAQANTNAAAALQAGFDQQLPCADHDLDLDLGGFSRPVGTPASVVATVTCRVAVADLGLPTPGVITISATMTSSLDTYRERR
ncbi:MAG: pilus assembly protein [Actinobacteria bacterium]|nr:pilus assembly protein [Actinomycetota bacterium]